MTEKVTLEPGDTAPDFTLTDDAGNEVSLADLVGSQVIVYFYPAAMTPGCTKQACDFTTSYDDLTSAGFKIIGISPDKPEKLARFRAKENLAITLLSDPDKKVAESYGAYGEKKMYGKTSVGIIRSTFVIDAHGKIAQAQYNVKATGHVERLVKTLNLA
ncbi:thioredoxin-dependent thiol peroxidase [Blastococcus sp. Marseille-P5729]|uniref:thioredoxin-dependent thiol peroxidase n=1 Tax=Blastococcus sp. Marseille-P5729 TaxID=2086582 RepID=UPI000D109215|nr:thioredoxin-dependent thiol peroxidase [Blastococcus sp. Marseille-P5729]